MGSIKTAKYSPIEISIHGRLNPTDDWEVKYLFNKIHDNNIVTNNHKVL